MGAIYDVSGLFKGFCAFRDVSERLGARKFATGVATVGRPLGFPLAKIGRSRKMQNRERVNAPGYYGRGNLPAEQLLGSFTCPGMASIHSGAQFYWRFRQRSSNCTIRPANIPTSRSRMKSTIAHLLCRPFRARAR